MARCAPCLPPVSDNTFSYSGTRVRTTFQPRCETSPPALRAPRRRAWRAASSRLPCDRPCAGNGGEGGENVCSLGRKAYGGGLGGYGRSTSLYRQTGAHGSARPLVPSKDRSPVASRPPAHGSSSLPLPLPLTTTTRPPPTPFLFPAPCPSSPQWCCRCPRVFFCGPSRVCHSTRARPAHSPHCTRRRRQSARSPLGTPRGPSEPLHASSDIVSYRIQPRPTTLSRPAQKSARRSADLHVYTCGPSPRPSFPFPGPLPPSISILEPPHPVTPPSPLGKSLAAALVIPPSLHLPPFPCSSFSVTYPSSTPDKFLPPARPLGVGFSPVPACVMSCCLTACAYTAAPSPSPPACPTPPTPLHSPTTITTHPFA